MNLQQMEVIDVDVFVKDGIVIKAKSSGNRLRGFEKGFIGKSISELIDIVPRTLATCSQAHLYALTEKMKGFEKTRALMLMLEIIESHLKHPYIYWFPNLNLGKDYDFPQGIKYHKVTYAAKLIRRIMEKIGGKFPYNYYLKGKSVQFKKEELNEVLNIIESEVLGMSIDEFLEVSSFEELRGDLRLLYDRGNKFLYFIGGVRSYLVVGFPFSSKPFDFSKVKDNVTEVEYEGNKVEVGPLAQALTFDPLVRKYHDNIGPSPLLREISRMKVMAKLLSNLESFIEEDKLELVENGIFINTVESIRGSLIHNFIIEDGIVKHYHILQPTSIIASRDGALEKVVEGLRIENLKNPVELTLAISSLDTCFVTRVRVIQDGKIVNEKRIGGLC